MLGNTEKIFRSHLLFLLHCSFSSCYMSESEGEEPAESQVVLPQNIRGRGNMKSSQSAIKLTEVNFNSIVKGI